MSEPEPCQPEPRTVPRMDVREFRAAGFLQEANRQFFHPLGLALEVTVDPDGSERLSGIWDYREDPEGMVYSDLTDPDSHAKAARVEALRIRHVAARMALLGSVVQPIGHKDGQPPAAPRIDPWVAERYREASREDLLRVVAAADRLWACEAEFEDWPGACAEYRESLDAALARCAGTRAQARSDEWRRAQGAQAEPEKHAPG